MENETQTKTVKEDKTNFVIREGTGNTYYGGGFISAELEKDNSFSVTAYKNPVKQELDSWVANRLVLEYDSDINHNRIQYLYKNGEFIGQSLRVTGCSMMGGCSYARDNQSIDPLVLTKYEQVIAMAEKQAGKTLINRIKPIQEMPKPKEKGLISKIFGEL